MKQFLIQIMFEDTGHGGDRWFEYCLVSALEEWEAINIAEKKYPKGLSYVSKTHFYEF